MNNDPLAQFRRKPHPTSDNIQAQKPVSKDDQPLRPLTVREALHHATDILYSEIPDNELSGVNTGGYQMTKALVRPLREAYEKGNALMLHQALGMAMGALREIPDYDLKGTCYFEYGSTHAMLPALNDAYEMGKETPAFTRSYAPAPEATREVDIEPEM